MYVQFTILMWNTHFYNNVAYLILERISLKNQFLFSERKKFFTSKTLRFYLFKFDEKLTEAFLRKFFGENN